MDFLSEAFKSLQSLTEETFDLSRADGNEDLKNFIDNNDDEIDTLTIIDDEAETQDELKDSYLGKVILDCNVCHSLIYKDPSEVIIDDDGENCNDEEECPYCFSTGDGYKLIGQIKPFGEVEKELEDEESEEEIKDEESIEADDDFEDEDFEEDEEIIEDEDFEESFKGVIGGKSLEEAKKVGCDKKLKEESDIGGATAPDIKQIRKANGVCPECGKKPCECECEENLDESIQDMSLTTDDGTTMEMTSGEDGEVTITTKPGVTEEVEIEDAVETDETETDENEETIGEVDNEVIDEIETDTEDEEIIEDETAEDETKEDETQEDEMTEFDEESFEEMGESYLKKTYSNVESFNVSDVTEKNDKLFVEGLIKFNSGNVKKTNFVFESLGKNKKGKIVFEGFNKEITGSNKAFRLIGELNDNKFLSESLNYRYNQNNQMIRGKITK